MHLKNFGKHLNKIQKYQCGLDYLFNESRTSNNDINAFKEARQLLNERRSNLFRKQMKLEKNSTKKKSFIIF